MEKTYLVESRLFFRLDPEWSTSQLVKFSSFSRAKVYAKRLPLGGWIDIKVGNKIVGTYNVSAKKARKAAKAS